MYLLNKGHILGVHFKYRHWFHSNINDREIQNSMENLDLKTTRNVHDNQSWPKKNEIMIYEFQC